MRRTILFGLMLIIASALTVSAADNVGLSTDNKIERSSKGKESTRDKRSSIETAREMLQNRDGSVLTRDDVDKASAYQGLVRVVTANLDDIEDAIIRIRRQIQPVSRKDLDDVQSDLDLSEKALNELEGQARFSVDRIQGADLRDRLFELKLSLELLRRRLGVGGMVLPFGMEFFNTISVGETTQPTTVPKNYTLRPKDKILILASSRLGLQTEYHEEITDDGLFNVPGVGRIKASGITIAQLSMIANKRVSTRFKQMKLDFTIEDISSVTIQVAGDVARPGTYTMPGMSTVMSVLYKAGGPSASGTMRSVILSRAGALKRQIDLYGFLMYGSKTQDLPLIDGDLVFVPAIGKTIIVDGEAVRPARYEPQFPLTLADALKMAGGVKPNGYLQQVTVERIDKGEYRILLSAPVQDGAASKFAVLPGDQIIIASVRPERTNIVTITGPVSAPGSFGYRENMKVSDLIALAQGVDPSQDVFSGRADILRIDTLKGNELISFDLGKALAKDPTQDLELRKLDKVFLYLPNQVAFRNNRIRISGAVTKSGVYDRKDGMNISDAIAAAGGVLPEAHLMRADLIRYKSDSSQELVKVNIGSALARNVVDDIPLNDRDELMIYTNDEVGWKDTRVRIEGAVQRPGTYKRVDNMRLSDLLFASGGLLPEAVRSAEIGRVDQASQPTVIKTNLTDFISGSEQDIVLNDRDTVTIPSDISVLRVSEIVYLSGEVKNPGPYTLLSSNEKLSDLIKRAGGLTQSADISGFVLMRKKDSFDNEQQRKDVQTVLKSVMLYADRQFITQLSQMGIKLPDQISQRAQRNTTDLYAPLTDSEMQREKDGIANDQKSVTSASGSAQNSIVGKRVPDSSNTGEAVFGDSTTEGKTANLNQNTSSLKNGSEVETKEEAKKRILGTSLEPARAMGERIAELSPNESSGLAAAANIETLLELSRISVDLKQAMANPDSADNLCLRSGDRLRIPKQTDTVTVLGAVMHPHVFAAGADKRIDYFIERSGGYAQDAVKSATIIVHTNGDAVPAANVKSVVSGDVIVVPSTGLIDIAKKWERIGSVTKVITDVLSSVYVLTRF